jgi:hypothetical protein
MAVAADYPGADFPVDMRGSYECCENDDSLDFEFGLRYFYSVGQHRMTLSGGDSYSSDDKSHILEGHLRIDDHSTDTFFKARFGYSIHNDSQYNTPATGGTTLSETGGHVAYAGADLAYVPLGGSNGRFGGLIGYNYMNEASSMGRINYTTASGGGDSSVNDLNIHALKLGVAGTGEFGAFSVDGEAAIIPYAWLTGTYGGFYQADFLSGGNVYEQGSAGTIDGGLYGASGELTFGFKPIENLSINFGGRASYLTGDANMRYTARRDGVPGTTQDYIIKTTALSFLRYGLFGGISGEF